MTSIRSFPRLAAYCAVPLALCFVAAVPSDPAAVDPAPVDPGETIVRRFIDEAWTAGKVAVIDELVLETYTCSGPTPEDSPQSRAALKDYVRAIRTSWPDAKTKVDALTSKDKLVTVRWTSGGTYAGTAFAGAKGRKISFPGTSVFTISADGKIASERCSWDTLDVLRQLGVEATPDTRDTMIANAQRLLHDVYGKGDYAALSQILADDYVMHVPSLRGESTERGAASVEKRVKAFRSALPDIKYEIHQIMVSGDTLVMRWSFRGTHRGELLGVAPSNKPVEITGMSMTRTQNGKFVETWAEWDRSRLLEQIGASPVK